MPVPHVLFVLHDAGGTVPPVLAVIEELIARGGRVTVLSQPSVEGRARARGAEFVRFRQLPDYDPGRSLEEQLEITVPALVGEQIGDDLLGAAQQLRPDVIVVDPDLVGALTAARTSSRPTAVLLHRMWATCTDVWFAEIWPLLADEIGALRTRSGLPAATGWGDLVAEHDLVLSPVPPRFDAPTSAPGPSSMVHTGFLVPSVDPDLTAGAPHPSSIIPPGDAPLVVVGSSTTHQAQATMLRSIVDGLRTLDVRAVVTTSGHASPDDLAPPPHVAVARSVPHAALLPDCAVMVTHGGMGSVAVALAHGVPLVCTPMGRDQHLVARRVSESGAGIVVDGDDPRSVGEAIRSVLADPSFRTAAVRLARESELAGGATRAVDELSDL